MCELQADQRGGGRPVIVLLLLGFSLAGVPCLEILMKWIGRGVCFSAVVDGDYASCGKVVIGCVGVVPCSNVRTLKPRTQVAS
eukprot:2719313-Amphidinium_carterae.1